MPSISLQVAFVNNQVDPSPTWTDISTYAKTISAERGSALALDLTACIPGRASACS
jgi:hypothetical protein